MPLRNIKISVAPKFSEEVKSIIHQHEADLFSALEDESKNSLFSVVVSLEKSQKFLDQLESQIGSTGINQIIVSNLETIIPKKKDEKYALKLLNARAPREELYYTLSQSCDFNFNFVLLILLSTIVATLGFINNQIIAVIAAMVIAPLLYTNLAIAFAVVIGDLKLLLKAIKITLLGIVICLSLSIVIGYFWPSSIKNSIVLLRNVHVGYTSIILALAAGAAGTISLTSNLSSALVGVMVAVALVPPLVTTGILLGDGLYVYALGSGLLFTANIICVNLASNFVFLCIHVLPNKSHEKKKAKKANIFYLLFWLVALFGVTYIIYFYKHLNIPFINE